jgi:hypothetical protein
MAITLVESSVKGRGFVANGTSADFSGCEALKAAVAGKSIYVERIYINSGAAINLTIGEGETTGAVTTVIAGPLYMAANTSLELVFTRPIKLTAATALTIDASGAGNATVIVQGFVE